MNGLCVVIMAKRPWPGRAKTRLVVDDFLTHEGASSVAEAMFVCTLERLAPGGDDGEVILVVTPDGAADDEWPALPGGIGVVDIIDQGSGNLGARIDRAWRYAGRDRCDRGKFDRGSPDGGFSYRPVAFFGTDTPDVPAAALAAIVPALTHADLAIGPTMDGGYWTLAARTYRPEVLLEIDWGGDSVYDQTCRRAKKAGLSVHVLPEWHDVDRPADVIALRRRLARTTQLTRPTDPSLHRLSERLTAVLGDLQDLRS